MLSRAKNRHASMYFAFLAQIKTPININRPTLINITHTVRKREFFHIATENSML